MSKKSQYGQELQAIVMELDAIRQDRTNAQDISLAQYVKDRWGISMEAFHDDLGINPTVDTIQNLLTSPDPNIRWLVPEVYREALRLGLRKAPIYPELIAGEQNVSQLKVTMPAINMSDAGPKKVGTAETIPLGDVSFQQKSVQIYKIGRGIKIPYEVKQYVALNLVAIYMQDMGVKMGMALDYLALTTAINGDQADGSDSAPVLGIAAANTLTYKDILKIWFRLSRLGRTPTIQIAGEDMAIDMTELYNATHLPLGQQRTQVNLRTKLPQAVDMYVHGAISSNRCLMIDKSGALIKLNAQPLLVESEKIVSNQTEATYATITTGFATIFRDSRAILDRSDTIVNLPFPTYMDPTSNEVAPMGKF